VDAAHDLEQDDEVRRPDPLGRRLRGHAREDRGRLALQVTRARVARDEVDGPARGHAAEEARRRVGLLDDDLVAELSFTDRLTRALERFRYHAGRKSAVQP